MPDNIRIKVDELQRRMQAGEKFTFIDTRNPQAWGQSREKLPGAIRLTADTSDESLKKIPHDKPIVAYCT